MAAGGPGDGVRVQLSLRGCKDRRRTAGGRGHPWRSGAGRDPGDCRDETAAPSGPETLGPVCACIPEIKIHTLLVQRYNRRYISKTRTYGFLCFGTVPSLIFIYWTQGFLTDATLFLTVGFSFVFYHLSFINTRQLCL